MAARAIVFEIADWQSNLHVVGYFSTQVIFVFLLFWGIVMYANEVETKEKQKLPEIKKINYNIYIIFYLAWFWGSKCNENYKRKFCSVKILSTNVTLPWLSHIIGVRNCSLQNKALL